MAGLFGKERRNEKNYYILNAYRMMLVLLRNMFLVRFYVRIISAELKTKLKRNVEIL